MSIRRSWLGLLAACAMLIAIAPAAHADTFGIDTFTTTVSGDQAGGHPDLTTVVNFELAGDGSPAGRNKDLTVTLPQGFLGNPQSVPVCHMSGLQNFTCPPDSQVGQLTLVFDVNGALSPFTLPVFHVDTQPGHAASFATIALIPTVIVNADIGPGHGYQLATSLRDASEGIPLAGSELVFWGVPADPSHDADRFGGGPADSPRKPFLTYPANCGQALTATADANSWETPDMHATATASLPAPSGCNLLSINPALAVTPGTPQADSPSGYAITTTLPQNNDPDGLATPALRQVQVTLPDGVSLAPPAADGLAACTDAQLGPASDDPATCPDAAKIGTVKIDTPLQADPLKGSLYFGAPTASNPFRIFLVASGPGTLIKLIGNVTPDSSGRLTTLFDNLPQLPFDDLTLTFFGGPRAVLANPQTCGTFTAGSALTAWSGQSASPTSAFDVTGCASPVPFAPSFLAGMTGSQAGGTGALTIQFGRSDGEQNLSSVNVDLPPGLLAHLGTVPQCSDAQANAGSCPADSQVGTASVAAGAGDLPLWLSGKTYLTGPYKGAPFGLAVVVPAVAGPLNLGTVVVRQAIAVNPDDAHVSVISDAFPAIVGGIPLRLRRLAVTVDRPDFLINPTNCDPLSITGVVTSTSGTRADVSSPFRVSGCDKLAFSPKLTMKFTGGKGQTKKGRHPGLVATVTPVAGQANLKSTFVTLPASVTLDANNLPQLCPLADAQKRACPQSSAVGSARVTTPLVNGTLSGPVYLVSGGPGGLPSLLAALSGPLDISVHAASALTGKHIVTKFDGLPDAPLSSFVLTIKGGSRGILVATRSLCSKKSNVSAVERAQNGRTHRAGSRVGVTCPKKKKRH